VDELANLARPILGTLSFAPLARADLLPEAPSLPPHNTMTNAYRALKGRTRLLLLEEWRRLEPPPPYYTFPLSLTLHPFMGLGKFMASRIHQMRAQKSYLATHPSWSRMEEPRQCPRCGEEEETFSHAILRCQSTSYHRERLLQGLSDVGPDSPLWSDKQLLLALAAFIRATDNYPPDMFPSLPRRRPRWSSPPPRLASREGCSPRPPLTPFKDFSYDGLKFPHPSELLL